MPRSVLLLLSVYFLASLVSAAHDPEDCYPEDCTYWNGPDCSDSVREECQYWIDLHGEPYFIQHATNCSRFWLCEPSDFAGINLCLFECAPCAPWPEVTAACPDHALEFDWTIKYPDGPVCNWPAQINCTNKACPLKCQTPDENGVCHPECCVDADCRGDTPICDADTHTCVPGCRLDSECDNWDGICPTCQWCNKPDGADTGKCEPGCLEDKQCQGTDVCHDHECIPIPCDYPCCIEQTDCRPAYDTECEVPPWNTPGTPSCEYCNSNGHHRGNCTPGCIDSNDMCPDGYTCDGNHECVTDCVYPCCTKGEDCTNHDKACQHPALNPPDANSPSCEYCTADFDGMSPGQCKPGCDKNNNKCTGDYTICQKDHECAMPGDGTLLQEIEIKTKKCDGCSDVPDNEGGAIIKFLNTLYDPDLECTTNGLDSSKRDYFAESTATFVSGVEENTHSMGECYQAVMDLDHGATATIGWGGEAGSKWTPEAITVTIVKQQTSFVYDCTPPNGSVIDNNESSKVTVKCTFTNP